MVKLLKYFEIRTQKYLSAVSIVVSAGLLSGCGAGRLVTAPVEYTAKGVWWTGKTAAKGTYYLGKGTVNALTYPFRDDQLEGIASWYGPGFHKKTTASGEVYDMYLLTAAHRELPLGTFVEVRNLTNGKKVLVKINDRGPFVDGRIIDLSYAAAREIDMIGDGTAPVRIRVLE
jgi:rare lipoprotein A